METLFFATGQVAKELGVTQDRIRSLCEAGLIKAEMTPGGQWRIPLEEVTRLKVDGLPQVPRPLPGGSAPVSETGRRASDDGLPPYASQKTVAAVDEVVRLKAEVEGLGLRRLKETELDWFRARDRLEADRLAEEEREEQLRLTAEQEECERVEWIQKWEKRAINEIPWGTPPEVQLAVHQAIRDRLSRLHPPPTDDVTRQLVSNEVQKALNAWKRREEIQNIIDRAVKRLPSEATNYFQPTEWQARAIQETSQAVRLLAADASLAEVEAAANSAVDRVAAEFKALKAAEEDARRRERVIGWAPVPDCLTEKGRKLAIEAITEVLAKLPAGTPQRQLEEVRDEALAPFRVLADQYREELAQRQREREELERKEREAASRRSLAEFQLTFSMWKVGDRLRQLEKKGDIEFDGFNDWWETMKKMEETIRPIILQEIVQGPNMTDAKIQKRIEELVDEHWGAVVEQ